MSTEHPLQEYRDAFVANPSTSNWDADTVLTDLDEWIAENPTPPVEPSTDHNRAVNVLHFAEGAIETLARTPGLDRQAKVDLAKAREDLVALRGSDWFATQDQQHQQHAFELRRKEDLIAELRRHLEGAWGARDRIKTALENYKIDHP